MVDAADTQANGSPANAEPSPPAVADSSSPGATASAEAPEAKDKKEKQGAYGKEIPVSLPAQISCQADLDKVLEEHHQWIASVVNPRSFIGAGRANLSHIDLRPYELAGKNLSGANLRGAILRGMDLAGINLTACNLREADLTAASLRNGKLARAKLEGATLCRADFTDAVLDQTDLGAEEILRLADEDVDYSATQTIAMDEADTENFAAQLPTTSPPQDEDFATPLARESIGVTTSTGDDEPTDDSAAAEDLPHLPPESEEGGYDTKTFYAEAAPED